MPLCGVDDEADKVTPFRMRSDQLRKTRCPYLTRGHALGSRLFGGAGPFDECCLWGFMRVGCLRGRVGGVVVRVRSSC